ncbi:autophagy-related protein 13 homolog [Leptidea sinapis]|uniref:autophagy-related protein 13 homolog n=1 Tax=Leptidea sinapis TaxID=189913 RepID=UPI002141DFB4|nr:autophagy-related protein 13 homolog [Leptidea sinapis]
MAPDAAFSNINDKNEFTKFTKFLAYKGVQVIVESRKGVKIEPNSKPQSGNTDWFNLQIPDAPEVNQAIKNALPSDRILETIRSQLNVEISVQTEDGDEMVLELWTLGLDETQFDTSLKAMNTVYFRMGILLKSLITLTRITPAYHLSRKQRTESFTIFYRVYNGEPKLNSLGDSVKKTQAGMLKTPLGGLGFTVSYRTNFSISPNKSEKSKTLLLKSDHFELSPKHVIFESKNKKEPKVPHPVDLNKPLRLAAFVDEMLLEQAIKEFLSEIPIPVCRFRNKSDDSGDIRVESKSTQEIDMVVLSKSPTSFEMPPKKFPDYRTENEPPLKTLQFPFADDHPIRELAEFYKEFFNAPRLKLTEEIFKQMETNETGMMSLNFSKDLAEHESSLMQFDKLVEDMCKSAD